MENKSPLLNELIKYHKENNILYSMPGNKGGRAFGRDEIGKYFADNLGYLDITEVDPLDNLHHPEGVIKESEEALAKTYNVKNAYFLVNGTTGGNLAAIFASFNEGDEVIIERNCHRSIYNAVIMRKLKVHYIECGKRNILKDARGVFLPPEEEDIMDAVKKYENAKGIILTYPNYFGISYNLESVIKFLKEKKLRIIVDEAHGAHYGISRNLPDNMASLADITITSAHKTLPSLTGGSYLLSNIEDDKINFYISAFMTTSPSYLIMASLDYARFYLDTYGEKDYDMLICEAEKMRKKINDLNKVKILSKEDLPKGYEIDCSRYVLVLPKGYSGSILQDYFRKNSIQCEMCFADGVVLILSPFECRKNLNTLYNVIKNMDMEILKDNYIENEIDLFEGSPKKALEPYEVFNYKAEEIDFDKGNGRILKESIVPYPPGIPIACPGEVVDKILIEKINECMNNNITILGMKDRKIKVCCL